MTFVSCSTIINGTYGEVNINTSPSKAKVFVNGLEVGTTPIIVMLERDNIYMIDIKYPGYKTYRITTRHELSTWFLVNLLFTGFVGMAVDYLNGTAFNIEPEYINIVLKKESKQTSIINLQNYNSIKLLNEDGKNIGEVQLAWK